MYCKALVFPLLCRAPLGDQPPLYKPLKTIVERVNVRKIDKKKNILVIMATFKLPLTLREIFQP